MAACRPRIVSMERLVAELYATDPNGGGSAPENVIKTSIHHMRRALGHSAVQTVWGIGYRLDPDFDVTPYLEAAE
jgi:DNA-binding response OmpR family regulator